MKEAILDKYLHLRLLVGYLGEAAQNAWWPTSFFQSLSRTFLEPAFPRTIRLAQYNGVREAARRLHDEHIGVGRVFHLFRLPEEMERAIHKRVEEQTGVDQLFDTITTNDDALMALATLADGEREAAEGPINVGKIGDLLSNKTLKEMARYYHVAFKKEVRSYPYLLEDRERE